MSRKRTEELEGIGFSPFYLEKGLFSYIKHLREQPSSVIDILNQRKKFFVDEDTYFPPYLKEAKKQPFKTKEMMDMQTQQYKPVDEICSLLAIQTPLIYLNHNVKLSDICRYFSPNQINELIRSKMIGVKDPQDPLLFISIEYNRDMFETSQQILLHLILGDGDPERKNYHKLFRKRSDVIGIGFFEHNEWKKMEKAEKLYINILISKKGKFFANRNLKIEPQDKKSARDLRIRTRIYVSNRNLIHPKGPFIMNSVLRSDDIHPLHEEIDIDHIFSLSATSITSNEQQQQQQKGNKELRNGMVVVNQEDNNLEYKRFTTSLNLNQPQEKRWGGKKNGMVEEICTYLQQYYVSFANKDGGRLVIGIREMNSNNNQNEKLNIIDGEIITDEESILKKFNELMENVKPQYYPEFGFPEFIDISSNFQGMKIIRMEVKKLFNNGGPYLVVDDEKKTVWSVERSGNHNSRIKGFKAFEKYFMYKDRAVPTSSELCSPSPSIFEPQKKDGFEKVLQEEEEGEIEEEEMKIVNEEDFRRADQTEKKRHDFDQEKSHCRCCRRNDIVIKKLVVGEKKYGVEDMVIWHRCHKRYSQSFSFRKRRLSKLIFAHGKDDGALDHFCDPEIAVLKLCIFNELEKGSYE